MAVICQGILPSGRAVRWERVATRTQLEAEQRVAARMGRKATEQPIVFVTQVTTELMARCLRAVAGPVPWVYAAPDPVVEIEGEEPTTSSAASIDVDAMLASVDAHGGWRACSYQDLCLKEGPGSLLELFADPLDYQVFAKMLAGPAVPSGAVDLAGKVQTTTG